MKKLSVFMAAVMLFGVCALGGCNKDEEPKPMEEPGKTTTLVTDKKPSELDARSVAYAFLKKQSELTSYELVTTGETVANTLISYTQKISNKLIKHGDEYFQQAQSSSSLVKVNHQAFVKNGKAAYRNALSGEITATTKAEYKSVYGVSPDDVVLGGFVMNGETILEAEKAETAGDTITYRYVIDGEKGGTDLKKQMKEYGNLNSLPVFSSVVLTLTLTEGWIPVSLTTEASYTIDVAVLGKTKCTQNITAVYSKINSGVAIPNTAAFNAAIGFEPSEIEGADGTTEFETFLLQTADLLKSSRFLAPEQIDFETGMHFGIDLDVGLFEASGLFAGGIPAEIYVKYNQSAIDKGEYLNAVNFRIDMDLHNAAPLFTLAGSIAPMLPAELPFDLSILASTYGVSAYYVGDGYLYLTVEKGVSEWDDETWETIFTDAGQILLIEKIDLTEEALPDIGSLTGLDFTSLLPQLESAKEIAFTETKTDSETVLALKPEFAKILDDGYQLAIDSLLAYIQTAAGDMGSMASMMLGGWLKADITGFETGIVKQDGKFFEAYAEVLGIPGIDQEGGERSLFRLGFTLDGKLNGELDGDKAKLEKWLADEEVAAPVREELAVLAENMSLEESYLTRLNALKTRYEALTDDQKALVIGSEKLVGDDTLADSYAELKETADEFLKNFDAEGNWSLKLEEGETVEEAWKRVNGLYDDAEFWGMVTPGIESTPCQLAYIGEEKIAAYLAARSAYESDLAA